MSDACCCGSGLSYSGCCGPVHAGNPAVSPEALMRSRYSAFVMGNIPYLLASWDERTRPAELDLPPDTRWTGLVVHESGAAGDEGFVLFTARFRESSQWGELSERSRFRRTSDGHWRYLDGDARFEELRPGRNDECPCGSGRKFKKCCG